MAEHPALDVGQGTSDLPALRDRLYALLDDHGPIAVEDDEAGEGLRVFFGSTESRNRAAQAIRDAFPALAVTSREVDDQDWARRSQADLHAIQVRGLIVAPPWDVPARGDAAVIVIEPSMGFGTGHHATTRLCLDLLQDQDLAGARVVDIGTGSGVLALAAARLGAASVLGADTDPDALANARENAARNRAAHVSFALTDLADVAADAADVVLANLTAAVLVRHAARLRTLVAPGGTLIVSGFGPHERRAIVEAFGWPPRREALEDGWMAVSLPRSA